MRSYILRIRVTDRRADGRTGRQDAGGEWRDRETADQSESSPHAG